MLKNNLIFVEEDLPNPQSFNDNSNYCYNVYEVECWFTDDWGKTMTTKYIFYTLDKKEDPLIFRLSALADD